MSNNQSIIPGISAFRFRQAVQLDPSVVRRYAHVIHGPDMIRRQGLEYSTTSSYSIDDLVDAVRRNDKNEVERLLRDERIDPNDLDEDGISPFHVFPRNEESYEIYHLLVEYGGDVNMGNIDGETPLMYAVQYGDDEYFRFLRYYEADLYERDMMHQNVLFYITRDTPVRTLIDLTRLPFEDNVDYYTEKNDFRHNVLYHGAFTQNLPPETLMRLYKHRSQVDDFFLRKYFRENLSSEWTEEHSRFIEMLMEDGVSIPRLLLLDILEEGYRTDLKPIYRLLKHLLNEVDIIGYSAFSMIAATRSLSDLELAIELGGNLDFRIQMDGFNLLHVVGDYGNTENFNYLIREKGLNPREVDKYGNTPFNYLNRSTEKRQRRILDW